MGTIYAAEDHLRPRWGYNLRFGNLMQYCTSTPILVREGTFFYWERGGGGGSLESFGEIHRGPPTFWNGLIYDPSEIPKQKHLTLPPHLSKTKITGSENNKLEVLLI